MPPRRALSSKCVVFPAGYKPGDKNIPWHLVHGRESPDSRTDSRLADHLMEKWKESERDDLDMKAVKRLIDSRADLDSHDDEVRRPPHPTHRSAAAPHCPRRLGWGGGGGDSTVTTRGATGGDSGAGSAGAGAHRVDR